MKTEIAFTPQITLPKAEPCGSLQELRRKHSALLRSERSERDSRKIDSLLEFIAQIKATGRNLASDQSREMAVGFLDYWIGVVVSRRPDLSGSLGVLELDPVDSTALVSKSPSGDPDHETTAKMRLRFAESAIAFENKLPSQERRCLRSLLYSLIRLSPSSHQIERALLARTDDILREQKVLQLAEKSKEAGVLVAEGTAPNTGFVLAHDCLLTEWPTLHEICNLRKSIREMASGWDKAGRPAEALLNGGEQLTSSTDFTDLNSIEKLFVEQSRRRSEHQTRVLTGFAIILVLILAGVFSASYWKVAAGRNDLERLNAELRLKNAKLEASLQLTLDATREASKINGALSNLLADYERLLKHTNAIPPGTEKRPYSQQAVKDFSQSISDINVKAYREISPRPSKK